MLDSKNVNTVVTIHMLMAADIDRKMNSGRENGKVDRTSPLYGIVGNQKLKKKIKKGNS